MFCVQDTRVMSQLPTNTVSVTTAITTTGPSPTPNTPQQQHMWTTATSQDGRIVVFNHTQSTNTPTLIHCTHRPLPTSSSVCCGAVCLPTSQADSPTPHTTQTQTQTNTPEAVANNTSSHTAWLAVESGGSKQLCCVRSATPTNVKVKGGDEIVGMVGLVTTAPVGSTKLLSSVKPCVLCVWRNGLACAFDAHSNEIARCNLGDNVLWCGSVRRTPKPKQQPHQQQQQQQQQQQTQHTAVVVCGGDEGTNLLRVGCVRVCYDAQNSTHFISLVTTASLVPPPAVEENTKPAAFATVLTQSAKHRNIENHPAILLAVLWTNCVIGVHRLLLTENVMRPLSSLTIKHPKVDVSRSSLCFATSDYILCVSPPSSPSSPSLGEVTAHDTTFGMLTHSHSLPPKPAPQTPPITPHTHNSQKTTKKSKTAQIEAASNFPTRALYHRRDNALLVCIGGLVCLCRCATTLPFSLSRALSVANVPEREQSLPLFIPSIYQVAEHIPTNIVDSLKQHEISQLLQACPPPAWLEDVECIVQHVRDKKLFQFVDTTAKNPTASASRSLKKSLPEQIKKAVTSLSSVGLCQPADFTNNADGSQKHAKKRQKKQPMVAANHAPHNYLTMEAVQAIVTCCLVHPELTNEFNRFVQSGVVSHAMCPFLIPTLLARKKLNELYVCVRALRDIPADHVLSVLLFALDAAKSNPTPITALLIGSTMSVHVEFMSLVTAAQNIPQEQLIDLFHLCVTVVTRDVSLPLSTANIPEQLRPAPPPPSAQHVTLNAAIHWLNALLSAHWRHISILTKDSDDSKQNSKSTPEPPQALVTLCETLSRANPSLVVLQALDWHITSLINQFKNSDSTSAKTGFAKRSLLQHNKATPKYEVEVLSVPPFARTETNFEDDNYDENNIMDTDNDHTPSNDVAAKSPTKKKNTPEGHKRKRARDM